MLFETQPDRTSKQAVMNHMFIKHFKRLLNQHLLLIPATSEGQFKTTSTFECFSLLKVQYSCVLLVGTEFAVGPQQAL